VLGTGYLLFYEPSTEIVIESHDEPTQLDDSGILIEVLDKDGNVIDSNRYSKPAQTQSFMNVWGIPDSDVKQITKELGLNLHGCCVGGVCSTNIDYSNRDCLSATGKTCVSRQACSSSTYVPSAMLQVTFTVTNIGSIPLTVEFTEGVVEGRYYD